MSQWKRVGWVPVDSGTVLISDPAYILKDPRRSIANQPTRADYQMVLDHPGLMDAARVSAAHRHGTATDDDVRAAYEAAGVTDLSAGVFGATLVQGFGGDGVFPLYAQFDSNGSVRAILVDFDDVLLDES